MLTIKCNFSYLNYFSFCNTAINKDNNQPLINDIFYRTFSHCNYTQWLPVQLFGGSKSTCIPLKEISIRMSLMLLTKQLSFREKFYVIKYIIKTFCHLRPLHLSVMLHIQQYSTFKLVYAIINLLFKNDRDFYFVLSMHSSN